MQSRNKNPKLSIIVPCRNEEKLLPSCLASLTQQQAQIPYEIIFVDTNSTDKSRAIIRSFGVRIINQSQKGKVLAFRKGAAAAKGDILCFTEADCIVTPQWIQTIYDYLQHNPRVLAVSGMYTFHTSNKFYNLLALIALPLGGVCYRFLYKTNSLRCSNFAIRKSVYQKAGGFPKKFLEFYDVELGRIVGRMGPIHHIPAMRIQTSDRRIRGRLFKFMYEFIPTFTHNILFHRPLPTQTYQHIR